MTTRREIKLPWIFSILFLFFYSTPTHSQTDATTLPHLVITNQSYFPDEINPSLQNQSAWQGIFCEGTSCVVNDIFLKTESSSDNGDKIFLAESNGTKSIFAVQDLKELKTKNLKTAILNSNSKLAVNLPLCLLPLSEKPARDDLVCINDPIENKIPSEKDLDEINKLLASRIPELKLNRVFKSSLDLKLDNVEARLWVRSFEIKRQLPDQSGTEIWYGYQILFEKDGIQQILYETEKIGDMNPQGRIKLIYAGDLDGDQILDLVLDLPAHEATTYNLFLFLSSRAKPGLWLEQVAEFRANSC